MTTTPKENGWTSSLCHSTDRESSSRDACARHLNRCDLNPRIASRLGATGVADFDNVPYRIPGNERIDESREPLLVGIEAFPHRGFTPTLRAWFHRSVPHRSI